MVITHSKFEVARALGLTARHVDKLVRENRIGRIELPGNRVRFLASDIEAFVETRHVEPQTQTLKGQC